ncbi:MAG TPA: gamma-glutamyl-gamma-aminobutyrate hydrolase family protein [Acidimicrobiales bacterium]
MAVTGRALDAGRVERWHNPAVASPKGYTDALERAGACGAVLPPVPLTTEQAAAWLAPFDGLVLTGGADLNPQLYGQEPRPETYGVDAVLDRFELELARAALDLGRPVLAICRGMQVLNVALGGTLDQHITGRPGLVAHGAPNGGVGALHEVGVDPGSKLAKALGGERVTGMSHHHQAVDALADGLVPVAWTDDGLVEGCEAEDGWVVAVQWHPEETADRDPAQQGLFDAFVAALR